MWLCLDLAHMHMLVSFHLFAGKGRPTALSMRKEEHSNREASGTVYL